MMLEHYHVQVIVLLIVLDVIMISQDQGKDVRHYGVCLVICLETLIDKKVSLRKF